jgi:hypothetical protein
MQKLVASKSCLMDDSYERPARQITIVVGDGRVAAGLFIEKLIVAADDPYDYKISPLKSRNNPRRFESR